MEKFNSDGTPQNESGKSRKKRKFPVWILLILVVAAGLSSVVVTYDNQYKLIRQFGKVQRVITTSGLSFKIPVLDL